MLQVITVAVVKDIVYGDTPCIEGIDCHLKVFSNPDSNFGQFLSTQRFNERI